MVRTSKIGVLLFVAAPKKGIFQRCLHHSCQQFAQTVNGQPLWRRGLQRRCCPGRGRGDIWEAARKGNVGAVRHLLRTEPGSLQQTDRVGPGPQSPREYQWGLEAQPETVLNLQAVTHQDHQGAGYIELGL